MRAVVQRVEDCSIVVNNKKVASMEFGLLVYLGVEKGDTERDLRYITEKVINLRIFMDKNDKMNLSVIDTGGGVTVVSQFTLLGDVRRGRRPSYTDAEDPEIANKFFESMVRDIGSMGIPVEKGIFGAKMYVNYTNVGPVTILLDSRKKF